MKDMRVIFAWALLGGAIAFEIIATFLLKLSHGFEKWWWGALAIMCYWACFAFLAPALKYLPVGIVYAVWAGIGIVGAALIGFLVFGERLGPVQLAAIAMILAGAIVLRLTTSS